MAQSTAGAPPAENDAPIRRPSLSFAIPRYTQKFCPRVGRITLRRDHYPGDASESTRTVITMDTPNVVVGTSRGVVPHFSRDHTNGADAIQWLNVPFESFLEEVPPVPTLQNGPHPLHRFFGFDEDRHITSLRLRDPLDLREMPPNGNTHVSANCVRGVKKVTLSDWRNFVYKMQADVVFALTDTPFMPPPHSQKRITKSIERSAAWLADLLRPLPGDVVGSDETYGPRLSRHPLNVFAHMAGGTSLPAREAFAYGLRETLHGSEAKAVEPLRCLDEGVAGYVFDLAALRGIKPRPNTSQHQTLPDDFLRLERPEMMQHPEALAEAPTPNTCGEVSWMASSVLPSRLSGLPDVASLFKASLESLPEQKPRLATGICSPHEMLCLIRDVGVDLFDVGWALHAANLGIALDFVFPVQESHVGDAPRALGHNLYDPIYARQFRRLADTLAGAGEGAESTAGQRPMCSCIACSPSSPSSPILHSNVDHQSHTAQGEAIGYEKPYSRAYIHHLLQTHEMSAHTLLVAHNLAVVSAFLAGVRRTWVEHREESRSARFALEVGRFNSAYDKNGELFIVAKEEWESVDRLRGKGRFSRAKQAREDEEG